MKDRDQIQADLNKEVFELAKSTDLIQREDMNPENEININETEANNKILDDMIKENSESLDWEKALPMTRCPNKAPPIILDNIDEVTDLNVCNNEIKIRDIPSTKNLSVLTSHYDNSTGKWLESRRASHPFISVKMTQINPAKNNTDTSLTTTLCLMADSGAMCSLLNHETVKKMGIDPESLEKSAVSITGVNGKRLQSQTRQMHVKIVNTKNRAESWEKVYVSQ